MNQHTRIYAGIQRASKTDGSKTLLDLKYQFQTVIPIVDRYQESFTTWCSNRILRTYAAGVDHL